MLRHPLNSALVATFLVAGVGTVSAMESTVDMQLLGPKGSRGASGQLVLKDGPDGVTIAMDLAELSPGPNGFYLYGAGDCDIGRKDVTSLELARLDVSIDEDGSEPLKTVITVPGMTVEKMTGQALIVSGGAPSAGGQPGQVDSWAQVACGVVR